jgi:16S rRNA (cytosine967-C5)-methyltransferase
LSKAKVDQARLLAYDLISQVNREGAYANIRLPQLLADSTLEKRDRALVTELAYGTLRMQGKYDFAISKKADRAFDQIDPKIVDVLRLALHQIYSMRVPDHAAVDESVELAKYVGGESKASYVNALLRSITSDAALFDELASFPEVDRRSIESSHPKWIVSAFFDQLKSWDSVSDLLEANNQAASPHLVAWPGKSTRDELIEVGGEPIAETRFGVMSTSAPYEYEPINQRRAGVQDLGSQIVAEAFFNTSRLAAAEPLRWLDMCAGPGGKAALLYNLIETERPTDSFTANEPWEHRAELVARVVPRAKITEHDGRVAADFNGPYDRILVDAPCTGLGALRRRPEARWRRTQSDLKELVALQRDLLASAYELLAPGGVLGYATCSPHLAETVGQLLDFRHRHKEAELLNTADFLTVPLPEVSSMGPMQLWTHIHGSDAMFLALIRKPAV